MKNWKKPISLILMLSLLAGLFTGMSAKPVQAATNPFSKGATVRETLINCAEAQLGLYCKDFKSDGMPQDQWCAFFIDFVSRASGVGKAGFLPNKYSGYGTTGSLIKYVTKKGSGEVALFTDKAVNYAKNKLNASQRNHCYDYRGNRTAIMPQAGDLIFFRWKNASSGTFNHVGMVYAADNSNIYYIDGNGSGKKGFQNKYVNTHTISRSSSEICAIAYMSYPDTYEGITEEKDTPDIEDLEAVIWDTVPEYTEPEEESWTGYIIGTCGALAINSTASAGNMIGKIPEGAACEVYPARSNGKWYWVSYNGTTGYSYGDYITDTQPETWTGTVHDTDGNLAINSRPKAGYMIGKIPEGASVTVFPSRQKGKWYWVYYNGVAGYSYSSYIR